jgi:hypothetical protein
MTKPDNVRVILPSRNSNRATTARAAARGGAAAAAASAQQVGNRRSPNLLRARPRPQAHPRPSVALLPGNGDIFPLAHFSMVETLLVARISDVSCHPLLLIPFLCPVAPNSCRFRSPFLSSVQGCSRCSCDKVTNDPPTGHMSSVGTE